MIRLRTSELAKLAEANGFTEVEVHRCMLDGAKTLLTELASGRYTVQSDPGFTPLLLDLAATLEELQFKIEFLSGMPSEPGRKGGRN